jgi:hypothetical protein
MFLPPLQQGSQESKCDEPWPLGALTGLYALMGQSQ